MLDIRMSPDETKHIHVLIGVVSIFPVKFKPTLYILLVFLHD